jgi:hypothetical protein
VNSLSDVFDKEIVMGASAEGASTRDFPSLLKNLLGVKFKIVAGYPGTREINLAMEKGEVQGACGETWSSVAATYPAWFRDKLVKPLVQESNVGYPELDRMGVPLSKEFAKTAEQKQIRDLQLRGAQRSEARDTKSYEDEQAIRAIEAATDQPPLRSFSAAPAATGR